MKFRSLSNKGRILNNVPPTPINEWGPPKEVFEEEEEDEDE